jgi:hypothetical protein
MMKTMLFVRVAAVLPVLLLSNVPAGAAEQDKPIGQNCQVTMPDPNAGEEGGHGMLLQIYPRSGDIGPTYTGCQAVFVTTAKEGTRLAWLIELNMGDPIRMWSPDPELKAMQGCRYRQGSLIAGDARVCSETAPELLPTEPAGCFSVPKTGPECEYDRDLSP